MKSIDEKVNPMTLGELKTLLKNLPRLDEELEAFASDLEEIASKSVADVNGGFMRLQNVEFAMGRGALSRNFGFST